MTFLKFTLGIVATFGLPWLMLIVIPFGQMRDLEPVAFDEEKDGKTGLYEVNRAGRFAYGSEIYGANGCYVCHTQVIRPTYAGTEIWRDDWAGQKKNADDQDTRRESNVYDYQFEKVAHIGLTRVGPDLSNVGYRLEKKAAELGIDAEEYIYRRLLEPRSFIGNHWSTCPSQPQLFRKADQYGQSDEFLKVLVKEADNAGEADEYKVVKPAQSAKALASYLLSLKKDNQVPSAMNYARGN